MSETLFDFDDANLRLEWFIQACRLIGGQRAMAQAIKVNERNVRYWVAGEKPLRDGVINDAAEALRLHAEACLAAADRKPR